MVLVIYNYIHTHILKKTWWMMHQSRSFTFVMKSQHVAHKPSRKWFLFHFMKLIQWEKKKNQGIKHTTESLLLVGSTPPLKIKEIITWRKGIFISNYYTFIYGSKSMETNRNLLSLSLFMSSHVFNDLNCFFAQN